MGRSFSNCRSHAPRGEKRGGLDRSEGARMAWSSSVVGRRDRRHDGRLHQLHAARPPDAGVAVVVELAAGDRIGLDADRVAPTIQTPLWAFTYCKLATLKWLPVASTGGVPGITRSDNATRGQRSSSSGSRCSDAVIPK
jgi:hypothetical protein